LGAGRSNVSMQDIKSQAAWLIRRGQLAQARKLLLDICNEKCVDADAWATFGAVNGQLGMLPEAVRCFKKSLSIRRNNALVYLNLGQACSQMKLYEEAVQSYNTAISLAPQSHVVYKNLGFVLTGQGKVEEAIKSYRKALDIKPDYDQAHSNLAYALNYLPDCDADTLYAEHRRWESCQIPKALSVADHDNSPDPERILRVGYLSADFRRHSVACFFEPLLDCHNAQEVTTFCYANVEKPDAVTERLHSKADFWRDVSAMSDDEAAGLIRSDGIDILVDLAGHTGGNRLLVAARKPAPVQVACIGYPVTTGLCAIDYRITDEWVDPPGMTEQYYTESLLRIEHGQHCYRPPEDSPDPVSSPEEINGFITFGTFNGLPKINRTVIRAWAAILETIPDSRLLIKNGSLGDPGTCRYVISLLGEAGIDPARVDLHGLVNSFEEHLACYGRMDISLDTFPYNGVTTTCEALWMGVPVITMTGDMPACRYGESLLNQVGLSDFIASDVDSYIRIAVGLAADRPLRSRLRKELRTRMQDSPLCDVPAYVARIEAAYRQVWRDWCSNHQV